MNEYARTADPAGGAVATESDAGAQHHDDGVTDPREVAALVLAQTGVVNAKKDELTGAIKALTDMAHRMAREYVGQMQATQELTQRVRVLEGQLGNGAA
jgi:hypothetical protein